ncbi:MAG: PAS domain S-box protein, partial [Desulfobacterales bacterium]
CTILPLLVISVIAYRQITADLRDQTLFRLKQITKSISMSAYERLLFLESEIQLIGSQLGRDGYDESYEGFLNADKSEFNQFKAMAVYDAQGRRTALFGDTGKFPEYAVLEQRVVKTNKITILTTGEPPYFPNAFMAVPIIRDNQAPSCLVGQANIENLGQILTENAIPAMTDFFVLDSGRNVLISSVEPELNIAAMMAGQTREGVSGYFTYNFNNKTYLAAFNKLFLKARYSIPDWTIILIQSDEDVLQSVEEFKTIFPLIILFSFLVILFLSTHFVRRSLIPLEKLKMGTQRVVEGNFGDKVAISSGDEFGDLADAFNRMAQKLGQQFNELRLTAAIGQLSAKIQDGDELAGLIMDSIREFLPFDRAALLLLNETKSRAIYNAGYGYPGGQKESLNILVNPLRVIDSENPVEQVLQSKEPLFTNTVLLTDGGRTRLKLKTVGNEDALTAGSRKSSLIVPIVYENKSTGALILEMENASPDKPPVTMTPDFWMGLGSQIAVSLSNAASFQKIQESEERFRKSFDHAAAGICLVATDGFILTANNYFLKMLGYEEKELLAKTLEDVSKPGHFMAETNVLKRLLRKEIDFDIYEKLFIHKTGHEIWGLVSISLLFNTANTPLYYIMHVQNLSELKEAEKIQKELESRLQKAQK